MSETSALSTTQLYRQWRGGDPEAGQAMAQRFSDWYYAVTAARLGDTNGRVPLQRSCTRFQQGIVSVSETDLVGWAHGLLAEEVATAGGRIPGGDFPNQLTGGRRPSELLARARESLPAAEVALLAHAYDSDHPLDALKKEAEALGGMPLAVLRARYALKRWLRDNAQVSFTEVPAEPNLDYAPLPLYEAGRMKSAAEETNFEKWLLSDMRLCKDIAEFGVFALALRAGAFRAEATRQPARPAPEAAAPPKAPVATQAAKAPAAPASSSTGRNLAVLAVVGVFGTVAVLAVVALLFGAKLLG